MKQALFLGNAIVVAVLAASGAFMGLAEAKTYDSNWYNAEQKKAKSASAKWHNQNNVLGINAGLGKQEFDIQGVKLDEEFDNLSADIYYRQMLTHHWGLELGYHGGTAGFATVFTSVFAGLFGRELSDIEYQGVKLSGYGRVNLSANNYLYGKLGANAYKMDYTLSNQLYDISGVNPFAAVGWEYIFDSGFGFNLEAQYLPMDDLNVTSVSFGFSYHF